MTKSEREILYEKIDAAIDEAQQYMPDATDAEIRDSRVGGPYVGYSRSVNVSGQRSMQASLELAWDRSMCGTDDLESLH